MSTLYSFPPRPASHKIRQTHPILTGWASQILLPTYSKHNLSMNTRLSLEHHSHSLCLSRRNKTDMGSSTKVLARLPRYRNTRGLSMPRYCRRSHIWRHLGYLGLSDSRARSQRLSDLGSNRNWDDVSIPYERLTERRAGNIRKLTLAMSSLYSLYSLRRFPSSH
jgi:hypothetical protein